MSAVKNHSEVKLYRILLNHLYIGLFLHSGHERLVNIKYHL